MWHHAEIDRSAYINSWCLHIDVSVQERCNSSALAMELRLPYTKLSISWYINTKLLQNYYDLVHCCHWTEDNVFTEALHRLWMRPQGPMYIAHNRRSLLFCNPVLHYIEELLKCGLLCRSTWCLQDIHGLFQCKDRLPRYRNVHDKDKTVSRPSYLYNGNSYGDLCIYTVIAPGT